MTHLPPQRLRNIVMTHLIGTLCVVILLWANLLHGAEGDSISGVAPAPLYKEPLTGMKMIYVKGGCFQMGASVDDCDAKPEERPAHEVCVTDFYLGKYEVTQREWKTIMGDHRAGAGSCNENNCPMSSVSWAEVQTFISMLNRGSKETNYRLPTEAEWEYAARSGGKNERYSGGNRVDAVAWYAGNSGKINHAVGGKAPNGLELHDMSGNVWEMVNDWYGKNYYAVSPHQNPTGPSSGDDHVIRGGCRESGGDNQRTTRRTAISDRTKGKERGENIGFRLLRWP